MRSAAIMGIVGVLFGFVSGSTDAQLAAPVYDSFDNPATGFDLAGWTTDAPSTEGVGWAVDGTPASLGDGAGGLGDPSTWSPGVPSLGSLNYNDDVNFEDVTDGAVFGGAMSPVIDVSTLSTPVALISYKVAIETETGGAAGTFPTMAIEVYDATVLPATFIGSLSIGRTGDGTSYELPQGGWRQLNSYLSWSAFGLSLVQVRFVFDSGDDVSNTFAGMFIDEFRVTCTDTTPPTAPTLLSPIGGATVTNPVVLDWTNATDTTDCGPGGISIYEIQIDDDPAFGSVNYSLTSPDSTVTASGIASGTWFWRVRALDESDSNATVPPPAPTHPGAYSVSDSFFIEPELPPDPPTSLFVNETFPGAQTGDGGFVNPLIDTTPAFSAIFTDPNTVAFAIEYRLQIALNGDFALGIVYDSGVQPLSPPVADGARTPDLSIIGPTTLLRDQTYAWRIAFGDGSLTLPIVVTGVEGPWSTPQSFRVGDDFEFGVRKGSSNHSKKCWVATAAWGSADADTVVHLQSWREGVMEEGAAGRITSRAYHQVGRIIAPAAVGSRGVRLVLEPAGLLAVSGSGGFLALAVCVLCLLGVLRTRMRV